MRASLVESRFIGLPVIRGERHGDLVWARFLLTGRIPASHWIP